MPRSLKGKRKGKPGRPPLALTLTAQERDLRALGPPLPEWVACDVHPQLTYQAGGFCEQCFADGTLARIKALDDGFAALAESALDKARAVLALPVEGASLETLKVTLGSILRAVDIVERRFKRPERHEINAQVRQVALVGSPVDFRKALEAGKGGGP